MLRYELKSGAHREAVQSLDRECSYAFSSAHNKRAAKLTCIWHPGVAGLQTSHWDSVTTATGQA
jgi:hypothetical protein